MLHGQWSERAVGGGAHLAAVNVRHDILLGNSLARGCPQEPL
jgi:hypothetical protein